MTNASIILLALLFVAILVATFYLVKESLMPLPAELIAAVDAAEAKRIAHQDAQATKALTDQKLADATKAADEAALSLNESAVALATARDSLVSLVNTYYSP